MPRKKQEKVEETQAEVGETVVTEDTVVDAKAETAANATDKKSAKTKIAKSAQETSEGVTSDSNEESSILGSVLETVSSVVGGITETVAGGVSTLVSTITDSSTADEGKDNGRGKRAEKIGMVSSDKMTKTVVVRVDRVVKHPVYRKYVKRRKKFMAHDELGSTIGDKVRIIETRPMSAKKRWRVVEIIQKAEK
ncbi:MAG: 30S ribosomal protein S17 [Pyrinomonadaceae bacterium]